MNHSASTHHQLIADTYIIYRDDLLRFLCSIVNHKEDAEDILQDTFERLLAIDVIVESTVKTLLFTTAHNIACDYLRRKGCWRKIADHVMLHGCHAEEQTARVVAFRELARIEQQGIERLTEKQRRIYTLARMDGAARTEIATALDTPLRMVDNMLFASRKAVRTYVMENYLLG